MVEWIQDFIRHSPFCVMATSNAAGDCDASPKGGTPGFVKVLSDKQLFLPGVGNTVRINGRVKVIDRGELKDVQLEVSQPDDNAKVLQGLLIDVEESYSHCPRALKFSDLWNVEQIVRNTVESPVAVKAPGI